MVGKRAEVSLKGSSSRGQANRIEKMKQFLYEITVKREANKDSAAERQVNEFLQETVIPMPSWLLRYVSNIHTFTYF